MSRRRTHRTLEQLPVSIAARYCPTGKVGYFSREDAQRQIAHLQRVRADSDGPVETREYRCCSGPGNGCGRWHLTSDRQRQDVAS